MGSQKGVAEEDYNRLMTAVLVPSRYTFGDIYALLICSLLAIPTVLVFLLGIAFYLLPLLPMALYKCCLLKRPLDRVPRGCSFWLLCCVMWPVSLPLQALAVFWAILVRVAAFVLSLPVGLAFIHRTCRSCKTLSQYSGRPGSWASDGLGSPADRLATKFGYIWPFADLVTASIGHLDRQGFVEFMTAIPFMISIVPVYKFVILVNPCLYDLGDVYINQWSDPLDATGDGVASALDAELVRQTMRDFVCRSLLRVRNRQIADALEFAGHHQYPPPGRESKTVAGLQFASTTGWTTLLSHTTHPYDVPGHKPRSETAAWGLIIVYLLSWNPWYQVAGYVEVNARKDGGVEHPMWMVSDLRSRLHCSSLDSINRLFVRLGYAMAALLREQDAFEGRPGPPGHQDAPAGKKAWA